MSTGPAYNSTVPSRRCPPTCDSFFADGLEYWPFCRATALLEKCWCRPLSQGRS